MNLLVFILFHSSIPCNGYIHPWSYKSPILNFKQKSLLLVQYILNILLYLNYHYTVLYTGNVPISMYNLWKDCGVTVWSRFGILTSNNKFINASLTSFIIYTNIHVLLLLIFSEQKSFAVIIILLWNIICIFLNSYFIRVRLCGMG